MPMGFKNAPFIFQRIMNFELRKWLGKGLLIYLDDIIIFSDNEKEHDRIFDAVQEKLQSLNFQINELQYKKQEIKVLDQIINGKPAKMPKEK
ncbi:putative Reverse transcriptase, LTR Retrotransposon protein, partial [Pseudoloma neurophilia]